jgi:hypothetical protein
MAATGRTRTLLLTAAALCVVGAVDSALDRAWDQVALFIATMLLIAAAAAFRHPDRRALTLRADLATWLKSRSELTGEPMEVLADRAVAAHRAGLMGREDPP